MFFVFLYEEGYDNIPPEYRSFLDDIMVVEAPNPGFAIERLIDILPPDMEDYELCGEYECDLFDLLLAERTDDGPSATFKVLLADQKTPFSVNKKQ